MPTARRWFRRSGAPVSSYPNAIISRNNIYIDGQKLPGLVTEDPVTVNPRGGEHSGREPLLMTVTFAVASVRYDVTEDSRHQNTPEQRMSDIARENWHVLLRHRTDDER